MNPNTIIIACLKTQSNSVKGAFYITLCDVSFSSLGGSNRIKRNYDRQTIDTGTSPSDLKFPMHHSASEKIIQPKSCGL